jgi:predicted neuraminidase
MLHSIFTDAPFPQCHGSTLARLPDGSFMACWFAGTKEQHPDTAIWWSHLEGLQWSEPKVAIKVSQEAHWNPVLFPCEDGMAMFFKVGRFPDSWDTYKCWFNGDSWSEAVKLKSKVFPCGKMTPGPVRGKVVRLSNGTLIAPSSIEKIICHFPMIPIWESVMHRSTDDGKTWETSFVPFIRREKEFGGIIQPSVWEISPGHIAALMRSSNGFLYRTESSDDGKTWSPAEMTDLPNPNSAVDISPYKNVIAMVHNPVSGNWVRRSPLSISFANKDGKIFSEPINIESGEGSFSYPAVIDTEDGFAITYTWNRTHICFVKVNIKSLVAGEVCPIVEVEMEMAKPFEFKKEGNMIVRFCKSCGKEFGKDCIQSKTSLEFCNKCIPKVKTIEVQEEIVVKKGFFDKLIPKFIKE